MPEKLELPPSGRLDARDEFGFLDEGEMTLREFCEVHAGLTDCTPDCQGSARCNSTAPMNGG